LARAFYDLAAKYDKNKWVFAALGVASYYVGTFPGGVALGLAHFYGWINIHDISDFARGLMAIPFGFLVIITIYHLLKSNWKKNLEIAPSLYEILDEDLN